MHNLMIEKCDSIRDNMILIIYMQQLWSDKGMNKIINVLYVLSYDIGKSKVND